MTETWLSVAESSASLSFYYMISAILTPHGRRAEEEE